MRELGLMDKIKGRVEFRKDTYGEYWDWFQRYGLRLGDLVEINGEKYIVVGMSKGPGFYSGDCVPIQFRRVPISQDSNADEIIFFSPLILESSKLRVLKHYSPEEFKQAKELFS